MMDDLPHPERPWTRTISEEMLSVSETRSRASWMRPSSSSLPYTVCVEVVVDRFRSTSKRRREAPATPFSSMRGAIVVFVQSIPISFPVLTKALVFGSGGGHPCVVVEQRHQLDSVKQTRRVFRAVTRLVGVVNGVIPSLARFALRLDTFIESRDDSDDFTICRS